MIKAVIFDMDGLMIDSERVTCDGYALSLEKRGYTPSVEFYKTTLGTNAKTSDRLYRERYGDDIPFYEILEEVHQYMADVFEKDGVPLKDGLITVLQYLKAHQYKTIIATSSDRQRLNKILQQTQLAKYFDDFICGNEVTHSKPNPEIFLKACQKLNLPPHAAIVIEDSEAGIQAAASANIPVICVPDMKYPSPLYQKKTFKIVNSLNDLIEVFENY